MKENTVVAFQNPSDFQKDPLTEVLQAGARRPKRCKLALSSGIRWVVAMKLGLNWSPEQIAGWLKRAHPGAGSYQVSHAPYM